MQISTDIFSFGKVQEVARYRAIGEEELSTHRVCYFLTSTTTLLAKYE